MCDITEWMGKNSSWVQKESNLFFSLHDPSSSMFGFFICQKASSEPYSLVASLEEGVVPVVEMVCGH